MIKLKVTKNKGFILSLEDALLEKLQWGQIDPPPAVLGLKLRNTHRKTPLLVSLWMPAKTPKQVCSCEYCDPKNSTIKLIHTQNHGGLHQDNKL